MTQLTVDSFGTPPATPRPAREVGDFVHASWRGRGARGACHRSAGGATVGLRNVSADEARYLMMYSQGARGTRHWSAGGATCGACVSAGGARWQMVESRGRAQSTPLERRRRDSRSQRRRNTLQDGGASNFAGRARCKGGGGTGEARGRDIARSEAIKYMTFFGTTKRSQKKAKGAGPPAGQPEATRKLV